MNVIRCCGRNAIYTALLLAAAAALAGTVRAQSIPRPVLLPSATAAPGVAFPSSTGSVLARGSAPVASQPVYFPPRPHSGAAPSPPAATPATEAPAPRPPAPITPHIPGTGADMKDADFAAPLPDEKTIHLILGHSMFIDTRHRLSRVYITNPDVLSSYTSNPNQVVITAKQAGLSTLIVWDEVGDTQVYMVSSETDAEGLTSAIKKAFPMESIDVVASQGRITLSGTVGTQTAADAVGKLASLYVKDLTNAIFVNSSKVKQVRLKVRFAEVDRSRVSQFGFNLFAVLNGGGSNATLLTSTTGAFPSSISTSSSSGGTGSTVGSQTVSVSNALNFAIYNAAHNIGATIQDLEDKSVLHILAEPNITTLSGEKANFLAGGEFPFPIVQGGTAGSAAAISIQFKPYGVKLEFTPVVNADGTIDLTVAPEVSALDYTNAVSISGYTIPALSTRRAQTQVVLRDGQTFAISGLLDQRTTDALGRTPGISNIPILGALFRSKNINHSNLELVVIVTPEIVNPLTEAQPTIQEPVSPVPLMNPPKFDEKLPESVKKPANAN